jgi:hypothetical protein
MGKKSKKGVARAGAKPRAAAGKGKRSGSVSEDGRSLASQDDHRSIDSAPRPIGTKPTKPPPGNVTYSLPPQMTVNKGDQNNKENSASASIPLTTAPAPAVPAPAAATENNGVWSGNLRDAVKADAEGPAVLDVTVDGSMDDSAPTDSAPAVSAPAKAKGAALAASAAEPVIQSRGF